RDDGVEQGDDDEVSPEFEITRNLVPPDEHDRAESEGTQNLARPQHLTERDALECELHEEEAAAPDERHEEELDEDRVALYSGGFAGHEVTLLPTGALLFEQVVSHDNRVARRPHPDR